MSIIGISGYAKSGKDTVGKIVQYLTSEIRYPDYFTLEEILEHIPNHATIHNQWVIKKWAGKLKVVASLLSGIPISKFEDQDFKQGPMPNCWSKWKYNGKVGGTNVQPIFGNDPQIEPMSVRDFLQRLGTEAMRNGLHEDTWVNALMADYHEEEVVDRLASDISRVHLPCKWVITDTRFPNEAIAIKNKGGIIIRINRPGVEAVNNHPSETSLDNWDFDHVINNDRDIEYLIDQMQEIMHKEKLLTYA